MWSRKFTIRNLVGDLFVKQMYKQMNKLGTETASKLLPIKGCECGCNDKKETDND